MQTTFRSLGHAAILKDAVSLKFASPKKHSDIHEQLATRLGNMRGLPQKLGQILSFKLDGEFDSQYTKLQENGNPLPNDQITQIINETWRSNGVQERIELVSTGRAASIGQVHKAKLSDDSEVAIKVQYPGIRKAVRADLKSMDWLSKPMSIFKSGFDTRAYIKILGDVIDRELDYGIERQNQKAMAAHFSNDNRIVIPEVHDRLSCDSILVSRWEDGAHIDQVKNDWHVCHRKQLSEEILKFFLNGILVHGQMQGDWHPGNFRFRNDCGQVQLVLYDFGCIFELDKNQRLTLCSLMRDKNINCDGLYAHFIALGFDQKYIQPIRHKLRSICQILFDPFHTKGSFDVSGWNMGKRLANTLGDDRWNFRFAGPPGLFLLVRAFHGLMYYMANLQCHVDWSLLLEQVTESLQTVVQRPQLPKVEKAFNSSRMKIRVIENGLTKVQISQPAEQIERLAELLSDDLQSRIKRQGINLEKVVAKARATNFAPGIVFKLDEANKAVEVSLE